jgi:hypothetical protein
LTLKALSYAETGGIVAAPTTSARCACPSADVRLGQTLPSRDFCGTAALPLKPDIGWRG